MPRVNTVSWSDCETTTRLCHALIEEMMKYQKHSLPNEKRGQGALGGDTNVCVAMIKLQERLNYILEKSPGKPAA